MRTVSTRVSLLALCALAFSFQAWGQSPPGPAPAEPAASSLFGSLIHSDTPIPPHLFGAGVGVQGDSLNGVVRVCDTTGLNMLCAVTSYSGGTTSNTVEGRQIFLAMHGFLANVHGNLGVATGADGGLGGAYKVGGGLDYNVSRWAILKNHPGYWVAATVDWDKRDVNDLAVAANTVSGLKAALKPFASKAGWMVLLQKQF